jgi:hypothetical protein
MKTPKESDETTLKESQERTPEESEERGCHGGPTGLVRRVAGETIC